MTSVTRVLHMYMLGEEGHTFTSEKVLYARNRLGRPQPGLTPALAHGEASAV